MCPEGFKKTLPNRLFLNTLKYQYDTLPVRPSACPRTGNLVVCAGRQVPKDLRNLNAATLKTNPGALPTLRMCTAPPLAVDRLIGLADVSRNLVGRMEKSKLPTKIQAAALDAELTKLCRILSRLLDRDIFPWLDNRTAPTAH